jgi:hypothetical protein
MKHRSSKKNWLFPVVVAVLTATAMAGLMIFPLEDKPMDYSQIVGQWVRVSGGYILDIQNVQPDGNLEAAYLNPRPINVSKAQANINEGKIDLFVELRDKHYPGSYYTLTYDQQSDSLVGIYHHLGIGQNISVTFSRMQSSDQAAK